MTFCQINTTAICAGRAIMFAAGETGLASRILLWGMVLLVLIVIAGVGLLWFRRRLADQGDAGPTAFSMGALEAMRASGELSEDEFRRLRRASLPPDVAAMARQADEETNCTLSPPSDGDDEDN